MPRIGKFKKSQSEQQNGIFLVFCRCFYYHDVCDRTIVTLILIMIRGFPNQVYCFAGVSKDFVKAKGEKQLLFR